MLVTKKRPNWSPTSQTCHQPYKLVLRARIGLKDYFTKEMSVITKLLNMGLLGENDVIFEQSLWYLG